MKLTGLGLRQDFSGSGSDTQMTFWVESHKGASVKTVDELNQVLVCPELGQPFTLYKNIHDRLHLRPVRISKLYMK